MKGLKWFPQSLPKTHQQQKLKAFHPRPFHPHPHLGKPTKLFKQSSDSKDFVKCEGSKMVSPKSTQNKLQQKLKAFHPRPFHTHPHLGKLATLFKQSSDSKDFLKCEGFEMVSPKSTQNKSNTKTQSISS